MRPAVLVGVALLSGCVYHLRVESRPTGASLTLDGETWVLPADLNLEVRPFARRDVRVEAPGYRSLAFRLSRRHVHETDLVTDVLVSPREAFGDAPRRVLEVRLVPDHGPSGTWTEDDVNR